MRHFGFYRMKAERLNRKREVRQWQQQHNSKISNRNQTAKIRLIDTEQADKIPIGAFMNKGLTWKTGQTHMQKYMPMLLEKIRNGEIAPSFIITHEMSLDDAAKGYEMFKHKQDSCIKVVLKPGMNGGSGAVH